MANGFSKHHTSGKLRDVGPSRDIDNVVCYTSGYSVRESCFYHHICITYQVRQLELVFEIVLCHANLSDKISHITDHTKPYELRA